MIDDISDETHSDIFSWQRELWPRLWQAKTENRLAHALLFVGMEGIGKRQFAEALACSMLCSKPSPFGVSCKACDGCYLISAKSHPDLLVIEPEEKGKAIVVDQIRDVIKLVNETTLKGGYRIIIVDPATAMNMNSANALLKTLEEPTPNTLLILISDQGLRLPATIISRCQKVIFAKPSHTEAMAWLRAQLVDDKVDPQLLLKLADGAPLKARSLLDKDLLLLRENVYQGMYSLIEGQTDPLQLAAKLHEADHLCVIDLLLSWLTDLLRYKLTEDPASLINSDYQTEITKVSIKLLHANLLAYIEQLQQTRADLLVPINLNKQLLLEDLLIRWAQYVSR